MKVDVIASPTITEKGNGLIAFLDFLIIDEGIVVLACHMSL